MLFASLALEREPAQWAHLPLIVMLWAQNAGAVAIAGLLLWALSRFLQREPFLILDRSVPPARRALLTNLFVVGTLAGAVGYVFVVLLWVGRSVGATALGRWLPRSQPDQSLTLGDYALTFSGIFALAVALSPIVMSVVSRLRFGRIWALARLSIKEAIRGRVVWVFGAMALVFLFADWFVAYKPEDQVRNYVRVVYWSLTPLFLLTSALLGSFSIPNDVKNNSIHTIVTKPVEKFEIVLGRFLGYGILLTVGLFVVSCLSLVYVVRGVTKEAEHESYKARVVWYGNLHFFGTKKKTEGESVGREWGYRSYIRGPSPRTRDFFRQGAVWDYEQVPADLASRTEPVRFEFTFDIFRLSKGEEGKGMHCSFTFTDGTIPVEKLNSIVLQMREERTKIEAEARKQKDLAIQRGGGTVDARLTAEKEYRAALEAIPQTLLAKHRLYQVKGLEVADYHTQGFEVPAEVFKVLLTRTPDPNAVEDAGPTPQLRVVLTVDPARESQMLGVAKQDFYLVSSVLPFWQNFLKGVLGMWCTHMLVLGIALACSTYLSGVISLLFALFIYVAGLSVDYLREVAENRVDGGGPTQSFIRVVRAMPIAGKLEDSPTRTVVLFVDGMFSWWIGRFLNLIPDLGRHDLHQYVANGFDIGWLDVLLLNNFLPLMGYLVPWAVLAYYLMKYREIANPS